MKLMVVLHPEEAGGYSVEIPALPGCISQGETLDEALANIREAAEGWIEAGNDAAARSGENATRVVEIDL